MIYILKQLSSYSLGFLLFTYSTEHASSHAAICVKNAEKEKEL